MNMIEKVARALARHHFALGRKLVTEAGHSVGGTLEEDVEQGWRACREQAVAAIEAMRKPTRKMLNAAGGAMSDAKRPTKRRVGNRAKHGIRYRAMIDAALEE